MNLDQIQRAMFHAVRTPLTPNDDMRQVAPDGTSLIETAETIIKPNNRLTSFERLELYNRQYWWRTISSLADDFEGLRALIGEKQFHALAIAYLNDNPSKSFTLRNLGSKMVTWLPAHVETGALARLSRGLGSIALDMVKLEWSEVEVFDGESRPKVTMEDLAKLGDDPTLRLQPYIRLLELKHPVHDLLLRLRERRRDDDSKPIRRIATRHLPKAKRTYIAVHRLDDSVYFKELDRAAFEMLTALQPGSTVSAAIDAVNWKGYSEERIAATVRENFANWASLGWFCQAD